MAKRRDGLATYHRLLAAGADVFSEVGYEAASITAIVARAGANVAAVKYHFGDKAGLYQSVWRDLFQQQLEEYPIEDSSIAASDRLRVHIRSLVYRTAGVGAAGKLFLLQRHERRAPTGLLDSVLPELHRPSRRHLLATLRELAPPGTPDTQIELFEVSILAQTRAVLPDARSTFEALAGKTIDTPFLDSFAEHIWRFSLRAMTAEIGGYTR
jgi:AcrR family transcriptional regulator